MKKNLIFILLLGLIIINVSCNMIDRLDTPSVQIHGNVIEWTNVENASSYELHIGKNIYSINDNYYTITGLTDGNYDIYVKAISSNSDIESSLSSSIITYNYQTKENRLSSPVIVLENSVLTWNEIENAISYDVYIGLEKVSTTKTTLEIKDDGENSTIFVIAVAKSGYSNSIASNVVKFENTHSYTNYNQVNFLDNIDGNLSGYMGEMLDTINERQLYDSSLWSRFVMQYRSNTDGNGYGWRGEFWGKMMEGACITYESTKDERLYKVLTNTVEDCLTTQQEDGGITSYGNPTTDEHSDVFHGWDMWNRRWTLQGMTYFYNICKDEELKARVLTCLCRQLDCITRTVGDGEGKININDACSEWGGLPTSSILEVVCMIYELTGKKEYFDFATHIINNGGSKYGNQIEQALANTTLPYTWGAPKAGELCTFFDGVLEYYYITGIEKYKTAAINYWYAVNESEITIVGGGCTKDEVFEHSAVEQADPTKTGAQQEFCVTIHWLNFSKDIYKLTNDPKVLDSMEITIYNAVLCCYDNEGYYDHVFNSYNNLIYNKRTTSAAGGMSLQVPYNWAYGCCISQGSIATGLIPLVQYATATDSLYYNMFYAGTTTGNLENGSKITLTTTGNYPTSNNAILTLGLDNEETFSLFIRIPSWSTKTKILVNGKEQSGVASGEYYEINRTWNNLDNIEIVFNMKVIELWGSDECSYENGKNMVALRIGPLTLARDARLDNHDIYDTVEFVKNEDGTVKYSLSSTAVFENLIEVEVELSSGKKIHLVNYGNAGKTFNFDSMFTTYMPTTDYWKVDFTNPNGVILLNDYFKSVIVLSNVDNLLHTGNAVSDYNDLSEFAVKFIETDDGYYYIEHIKSGKYYTVTKVGASNYFELAEFNGSDNQKFKLDHSGLMSYMISCKIASYIVSANNETDPLWLYSNCGSSKQYWSITLLDDLN